MNHKYKKYTKLKDEIIIGYLKFTVTLDFENGTLIEHKVLINKLK